MNPIVCLKNWPEIFELSVVRILPLFEQNMRGLEGRL